MLLQGSPQDRERASGQCAGGARLLCEPVQPPKGELEHIHYFCGNTEIETDLQEREPQRVALYKATASLVRAYANIADELEPAGYSSGDVSRIKQQMDHYLDVRETIRQGKRRESGRESV